MQHVFISPVVQKELLVRFKLVEVILAIKPFILDLLIDISDALQICCYELGRTYLKLSQALCINVPSIGELKTTNIYLSKLFSFISFNSINFFSKITSTLDYRLHKH